MKKKQCIVGVSVLMAAAVSISSYAAGWSQSSNSWKYQKLDGTYASNGWYWLDGNYDGTAECYYFDSNGNMYKDTITPDSFQVDKDGAWVINQKKQTRTTYMTFGDWKKLGGGYGSL